MRSIKISTVLALLLSSQAAHADIIYYEATDVGGDIWEYSFTLSNETPDAVDFGWFTIFFDPALYAFESALTGIVGGPDADWDILYLPFDDLLTPDPDDDLWDAFDAFALSGLILEPGEMLTGFMFTFEWLGAGSPGSNPFTRDGCDRVDPQCELFFTEPLPMTSVPEPGTLLLLVSGLIAIAAPRRRRPLLRTAGTA